MELNKSFLVLVLVINISLSSIQAHRHRHHIALSPSPSLSNPPNESSNSPYNPCKPVFLHSEFPFLNPPSLVNPILDKLCAVTHNPLTCSSFITPCLSTGDSSVDSHSVLTSLILQLSAQVENTISIAKRLCKIKSLSPSFIQSLDTSIELYTKVIDELKNGLVLLQANDISGVETIFTSAITKFGLCDEAFYQHGSIANWPLKGFNELLTELAGFGVDISAQLSLKVKID